MVNYAHSRDEAEAVASAAGGIAVQADIVEDAACRALAKAAIDAYGRIDFLVNNAGLNKYANHEDLDALDAEDFVDIYRLNTIAPFQMVRACAPALRESGMGAVVNVASVAGVYGHGSSVAYAASKGAMITMTKSLARCWRDPSQRWRRAMSGRAGSKRIGRRRSSGSMRISPRTPMAMAAAPRISPGRW